LNTLVQKSNTTSVILGLLHRFYHWCCISRCRKYEIYYIDCSNHCNIVNI